MLSLSRDYDLECLGATFKLAIPSLNELAASSLYYQRLTSFFSSGSIGLVGLFNVFSPTILLKEYTKSNFDSSSKSFKSLVSVLDYSILVINLCPSDFE